MSMLSMQIEGLREAANCLDEIGISTGHDTTASAFIAHDASERMRSAAYTIESLGQKIEDLEGMLGELPPEGKCAMLLVNQVDGEYVWGCERYDFASYCLVDSEADTYTGMTLNDPFGRADFADKLTMAKELRKMAASLDAQGDILGVLTDSDAFGKKLPESRYSELFGTPERAVRTLITVRKECEDVGTCYPNCPFRDAPACPSDVEPRDQDALLEWLKGEDEVIDEPDTIRNELADGGLIADVLAPVCVNEKERRAFERGRVHERFAQQIFKEAGMRGDA